MIETVHRHLTNSNPSLDEIRFVLFSEKDVAIYENALGDYLKAKESKGP